MIVGEGIHDSHIVVVFVFIFLCFTFPILCDYRLHNDFPQMGECFFFRQLVANFLRISFQANFVSIRFGSHLKAKFHVNKIEERKNMPIW